MTKTRNWRSATHLRIARMYDESWKFRLAYLLGLVLFNLGSIWLIQLAVGNGYLGAALAAVWTFGVAWASACLTTPPIEYYERGGWQ